MLTLPLHLKVFRHYHAYAHPGPDRTYGLVTTHFVWESINVLSHNFVVIVMHVSILKLSNIIVYHFLDMNPLRVESE